jgi:hypothetical protein
VSTTGVENAFAAVDPFLDGLLRLHTLNAALDTGLVDLLDSNGGNERADAVARRLGLDARELEMLEGMLRQLGVLERDSPSLRLTETFRTALEFRDLLEAKLEYALLLSRTMGELYPKVVRDPRRYLGDLIEIFQYDNRHEFGEETRAMTRRWVRYMSTLTRYEAPWLLSRWDVPDGVRILEIGGNIGELARQVCQTLPGAAVTICDIPVVCALGREHVAPLGLGDRIQFIPGSVYEHPPTEGRYDLLLTKSFLHDWDMEHVRRALTIGTERLGPGGRVVIFEKLPYDFDAHRMSDAYVVDVPFMSHLRDPLEYVRVLEDLGFGDIRHETVDELHFMLLTAARGDATG